MYKTNIEIATCMQVPSWPGWSDDPEYLGYLGHLGYFFKAWLRYETSIPNKLYHKPQANARVCKENEENKEKMTAH